MASSLRPVAPERLAHGALGLVVASRPPDDLTWGQPPRSTIDNSTAPRRPFPSAPRGLARA